MRVINQEELNEMIEKHEEWVKNDTKGEQLVLVYSNLDNLNFNWRNLKGAILSDCSLKFTSFIGANLSKVDLNGSNLKYSNLNGSDLGFADLSNCDLTNTIIEKVNFKETNLNFSNLAFSSLKGSKLTEALLYETNLFYAIVDDMISCGGLGDYNRTIYYFYKEDRIICGCLEGTLKEFENKLLEKYKEDSNYFLALEMFKKMKNK